MRMMQAIMLIGLSGFAAPNVQAEQVKVDFEIVSMGWVKHPKAGEGVELIYQFSNKPTDDMAELRRVALSECNRVIPEHLPAILKGAGKSDAKLVVMTFRFGGRFGTYVKWAFRYEGGVCSSRG